MSIDAETAPLAVAAGANVLGFGERDGVVAAMEKLRAALQQLWKQPQQVEYELGKGVNLCNLEWSVWEEWAGTWCGG
jgi:hypothetical protein